jgi:hypothetical protein
VAHDLQRTRTVAVRVVRSRVVRRLLVLAGIAVTGWLIGGAQAHADEAPAPVPHVVSPVQGQAPGALLRQTASAVRGAAAKVGATTTTKKVLPALTHKVGVEEITPPAPRTPRGVSWVRPRTVRATHGAPAVQRARVKVVKTHKASRHVAVKHVQRASQRPMPAPATPFQDPAQAVSSAPASGAVLFAGFGGPLSRWSWAAARPLPTLMTAPGAVPPAVRSAADEPSFAPD